MKTSILTAFVALSIVLTACSSAASAATPTAVPTVQAEDVIISEGRVEPVRYADIALNTSGLVSAVPAAEGDEVRSGQVIARVESEDAQDLETARANALQEVTDANKAVSDAQFFLDDFFIPGYFKGLTPAQAVEKTRVELDRARKDYAPYKNDNWRKIKKGPANLYHRRLDDAWDRYRAAIKWMGYVSDLEAANSRLKLATETYDSLKDPIFVEGNAGVRAALANAELRAPFAGTITNLDLKVGEFATSGQPVATVADLSSWVVKTTDLTEIDVVAIEDGQPVTITLDALPAVTLNGHVLSISQAYVEKQGDIVYEVTVLLVEDNPAMRWGMTAEVKFEK